MKFGGIVLQMSMILDLMSHFQDGGHDVISRRKVLPLVSARTASARQHIPVRSSFTVK